MNDYLHLIVLLATIVIADIPPVVALVKTSQASSGWPMLLVLGGFIFIWAPAVSIGILALEAPLFAGGSS